MLWHGVVLSALGVLVTGALLGAFLHAVVGYSWLDSLLLGAIVSSTDAAAVFAILRARNVRLPGRVRALLELESGSNDPMAVFLTMTVIRLITSPSTSVSDLISMFVRQMALGASLGYGLGRAIIFLVNRMRLEYEGLYPVLTLSWFSSPTAPPPGSEATGSWPSTSPDWSWATVPSFTSEA